MIDKEEIARNYTGNINHLVKAFGIYDACQLLGYEAVEVATCPTTITNANKILGIKIKEHTPRTTALSEKSLGWLIAKEGIFKAWEISRSKVKVDNKKKLVAITRAQEA